METKIKKKKKGLLSHFRKHFNCNVYLGYEDVLMLLECYEDFVLDTGTHIYITRF